MLSLNGSSLATGPRLVVLLCGDGANVDRLKSGNRSCKYAKTAFPWHAMTTHDQALTNTNFNSFPKSSSTNHHHRRPYNDSSQILQPSTFTLPVRSLLPALPQTCRPSKTKPTTRSHNSIRRCVHLDNPIAQSLASAYSGFPLQQCPWTMMAPLAS